MSAYLVSMGTYAGFFMILALALNLQWGITGMVNFGIAGFYALGAYTSGLLAVKLGVPVGLAIPAACLAGLGMGAVVALLSVRLREDFLAIVTLGVGEVIRLIVLNEDQITEGPRGLRIEARPFLSWPRRGLRAADLCGLRGDPARADGPHAARDPRG